VASVEKVVQWGSGRVQQHERDLNEVLQYLYVGRSSEGLADATELDVTIGVFETQLAQSHAVHEQLAHTAAVNK